MYISMNWISDFVDLSQADIKQLIGRFTLATAEVEEVIEYGKDIRDVVIGKVVKLEEHPKSKKLHLLKVDNGEAIVDCVCGAPNVFEGAIVAFAKCGGSVKGMEIGEATIAGYPSRGMCCSEKELGISEDHSGIMLFDDSAVIGTNIKDMIAMDDIIFEVDNKSLTNRPDLWGHYGIAREIAALLKRPLKALPVVDTKAYAALPTVDLAIETELCYRYSCIGVENVTRNVSPLNMKVRLMYCGQRPINLLADLTNYLMMELGQPMHAFDKNKVDKIRVKTFDHEKEFVTLDATTRMIEPGIMMICDDDEPTAVAGIMGGLHSEIEDDTTSLMLESANFDGVSIRKSATKLGMRTEASARYEKMLDPEMTVPAIERFLQLLMEIDPGVKVITAMTDSYPTHYETIHIQFDKAYVDKYTGIDISNDEIIETLTALEFKVTNKGDEFEVVVPSFRATKDVTIKADIIEEITRIYGYDNFKLTSTASLLAPVRPDKAREDEYLIKQLLAERFGCSEVHSYIWYDAKMNKELGLEPVSAARVVNSVASENDAIRSTIIPTLLGFVYKNLDNYTSMQMFEIGRVVKGFTKEGLCNERKVLSIVSASKEKSAKQVLSEVKEMIETISCQIKNKTISYAPADAVENYCHPKNSAKILLDGKEIGLITELNPRVADKIDKKLSAAVAEIDFACFAEQEKMQVLYKEISKFPGISIDLSLLVDDTVSFGLVHDTVMAYECKFLQSCEFIDMYKDKALNNKASMTIRMQFISYEGTLSGDEVNGYTQDILKMLAGKGIKIRE